MPVIRHLLAVAVLPFLVAVAVPWMIARRNGIVPRLVPRLSARSAGPRQPT